MFLCVHFFLNEPKILFNMGFFVLCFPPALGCVSVNCKLQDILHSYFFFVLSLIAENEVFPLTVEHHLSKCM